MKRFLTYLFWSLLVLALVFASVAVPVALAKGAGTKDRESGGCRTGG